MGVIARLLGRRDDQMQHAYAAVVALARDPAWYARGGVPDTLDGRFEMVSLVMALALARLEALGGQARPDATYLTEHFITDMDGQLREIGIGDLVVGKQVGKMMGHLGGRIAAYRGEGGEASLGEALDRNLWRGNPPPADARSFTLSRVHQLSEQFRSFDHAAIVAGKLPTL